MKLIVEKNYNNLSKRAADILGAMVREKPDCVLGLATGSTPLGIYRELIKMNQREGLDFSRVKTFNLDEYYGLSKSDPQSYHYYMEQNFFSQINIKPENTFIPDGNCEDVALECERYDRAIEAHGGLDIQLLGLGRNGHIGFNEPGAQLRLDTHLVKLSQNTIKANSRFFPSAAHVPKFAITMGIGAIMKAKKILLVVSGADKAAIVKKLINDRAISTRIPASILHLHQDVTVLLDMEIASAIWGCNHEQDSGEELPHYHTLSGPR